MVPAQAHSPLPTFHSPLLTSPIFEGKIMYLSPPLGERPFPIPVRNEAPASIAPHDAEFRKQIFKEIDAMQLKLNDIMENVALLLKRQRLETEVSLPTNVPDIMHCFPVDEKSLFDVENWLESNTEHKKVLAKELSYIGGTTVKEVTRRIMARVFTNAVGVQYSWEGAKKKKIFKKLALASTILSAVRQSKTTFDIDEAEVIGHIKAWLVRCKDRIKNSLPKSNNEKDEERVTEKASGGRKDKSEEREGESFRSSVNDRGAGRARDASGVRFRPNNQTNEVDRVHPSTRNRVEITGDEERSDIRGLQNSDNEIMDDSVDSRVRNNIEISREHKSDNRDRANSENSFRDKSELKAKDRGGEKSKNNTQTKDVDEPGQITNIKNDTPREGKRVKKRISYSDDEVIENSVEESNTD